MKSSEVRQSFLDFFAERDHRVCMSSPLVPQGDPTLLFTNAGMVPFKDFFLGVETPPSPRATSSQKCLRVSGKHNDLENVGPSPRHHTFFEMLGNFSFGEYFKAEAIEFAWDLTTKCWGFSPDHLFATVYEEDDEAFDLWKKISGLDESRIVRCGKADNFWAMGDVGPCGPCSELHIDRHPDRAQVDWSTGSESGRYFEFWNLVFMQFESDADGNLTALPSPSIDTGCGLERVTAVLQGVDSNYDTDLFQPLIRETARLAGRSYGDDDEADVSMRVVADHLRAVAFLLVDGVVPSNEGRGYVLRRILRRAVRHGMRLGFEEPFFYRLLPVLEETMSHYPELGTAREASAATIESEEGKFLLTVASGARQVQGAIESARREGRTELDGETVFRLYDTHGLPPEMVQEIAEEEAFSLDHAGFEAAMDRQRERSRSAGFLVQAASGSLRQALRIQEELPAAEFSGYDRLTLKGAVILRLARQDGEKVFVEAASLALGEQGVALLNRTVFYGEGGGQVGDRGTAVGKGAQLEIVDTQKDPSGLILHHLKVCSGSVAVGAALDLCVNEQRRVKTQRNHTATHLLQAALRDRLGPAVRQAGSLVDPDRLRFDFTFDRPLDDAELAGIEEEITAQIRKAQPIVIGERSHQDAVDAGAMALFGEKYGDRVRTVEVPGCSLELCGGCHVGNTGEIGGFRIVSERGVASGVRRVEAITGDAADRLARIEHAQLHRIEEQLGAPAASAAEEIEVLRSRLKEAEKGLTKLRLERLAESGDDAVQEVEVAGIKVISREVACTPFPELRSMADVLKQKLGSGVVVLGTHDNDKVNLVVAVSDDVKHRIDAGELARRMGSLVGGNGGGRAGFAQAGGKDPALLAGALTAVPSVVEDQLAAGNG